MNPEPNNQADLPKNSAYADEDDGGRSANQQLIDEGIARAEFELMLQASRARSKFLNL